MTYKVRKKLNNGPRNPYYINIAWFHLKRPRLKLKRKDMVDGHPIIHVDTGRAQ